MDSPTVSIITPTLRRPDEVKELLENISQQSVLPVEVILVDGAPAGEDATETVVQLIKTCFPFDLKYLRRTGGTAIQRNHGIGAARGRFVAFVDDDVRLEEDFLKNILEVFGGDLERKIGGLVGCRTNQYFDANGSQRWRWYKRLRLLSVFEPGRYDFRTGYPINANLQAPFSGTRPVDFMTTACAVWRREVFDLGLRFHHFFTDYGVLEDAHFSLRAGRTWKLLQCGDAHCEELHSPKGRPNRRKMGYKAVVNYYFVFRDIVGPLTLAQKYRFWRYQAFELLRIAASAIRRQNLGDIRDLRGRIDGIVAVVGGLDHS